jgi:S-adenosylmethionine hydrolase
MGKFVPLTPFDSLEVTQEFCADLQAIVYIDNYGNLISGLRASMCGHEQVVVYKDHKILHADRFETAPVSEPFWYVNSIGLVEISINRSSAAHFFNAEPGQTFDVI